MPYESVYDFNQIDLTRHGLIEASAGTGKTYTIENLVVRLLKETDAELENILLVTFTEKAASELKIRIREKLEGELDGPDDNRKISKKLSDTLDAFDKAPIHTIHGFCQTVLRDFAFENSVLFQSEVINDTPLFETLMREQMRKYWPEIYGEHLEEILEISKFNQKKGSFLDTIIKLAQSLHKEAGDRLLPDLRGRGFNEIKQEIASACMGIKDLLGSDGEFSIGYDELNFNKRAKRNILDNIVIPVEEYFEGVEEDSFDICALSDLMSRIEGKKSGGRKGLETIIPNKWNKGGQNLEVCPNLETVRQALEKLNIRLTELQYTLSEEAIHRLQDDVTRTKQGHGWISYYDMLSLVEKALYGDNSSNLLEKLRNRFKVAFIDEFQDTDPVQWKIFRRIFINSRDRDLQNLLFVIGDPKQAIYSFRGADVYAYLSAKNEMEKLETQGQARLYSLSVNWRSRPALITAFNKLFCGEAWFKPQETAGELEIGYQSTGFPAEEDRLGKLIADDSGSTALNIVDLTEAPSPRPAKARLARFVAREIKHLLSSGIRIKEKEIDEREIGVGDICILVRSRSDVPFIEEELKREKLPYTFYKKPGLFVSDEAVYTSLIFRAILKPGDSSAVKKALLTPFFRFDLNGLYAYEEMSPSHPVKEMLFRWNEYAMSRKWSHLFQSLVEDSGLLSRETVKSGWDRKYTNYNQIFEHLEEVAYRRNLDFRGLSATLDTYRNQSSGAEEGADIHQIETEAQKVQIMTMHVSKGLEFPVVFVAGGLTQPGIYQDKYHTYHEIKKGGLSSEIIRIFDLAKSGGDGRHESEKMDEDKRLYYVASTRARFKLYLPFYKHDGKAQWLGPVCTRLSPALLNAFPDNDPDKDVLWLKADRHSGLSPARTGFQKKSLIAVTPAGKAFDLPSFQRSYEQRRIRIDSFSSLHQKMSRIYDNREKDFSFQTEQRGKEDDEGFASPGTGAVSGKMDPDEVPGGIDVGLMFHDILEHIDYGVVLNAVTHNGDPHLSLMHDENTREIISGHMETYRVDKRWKESVCRIVSNTLTTPVASVADDFILAHLQEEERLHEVEFYYSFSSRVITPDGITDGEISSRFMRGFVDLVFRKGRKFYVADWKSNYLETGYDLESMRKSMDHADYHLQYKLYAVAVLRWLKQTMDDQFDPESDFGGIFYFYLRGMGMDEGTGIYHVPPDELGSLEQLEEEIALIFDKAAKRRKIHKK